jgi:hypothetical protein
MSKISNDQTQPEEADLLPLHMLRVEEMPIPLGPTRLAGSDTHHAEGYVCEAFYKPISRCVGE